MHWFSMGVALLAAVGIIWIGTGYVSDPRTMAPSFGLPLPEEGANIAWWLRLKGIRDVASGLLILAFMALLVESIIPIGDMSNILAAKGSAKTAFGVHGVTAVLMILGAIPLIAGAA